MAPGGEASPASGALPPSSMISSLPGLPRGRCVGLQFHSCREGGHLAELRLDRSPKTSGFTFCQPSCEVAVSTPLRGPVKRLQATQLSEASESASRLCLLSGGVALGLVAVGAVWPPKRPRLLPRFAALSLLATVWLIVDWLPGGSVAAWAATLATTVSWALRLASSRRPLVREPQ